MFPTNKSIFTGDFHVNESNINDDPTAKEENISTDLNVIDGLRTMANDDFNN